MKCPNCAAPREPWRCDYCGDEDPSLKPRVYRGDARHTAITSTSSYSPALWRFGPGDPFEV